MTTLPDLIDRFEAGSLSASEHPELVGELVGELAALSARVQMAMMVPRSSNGHGDRLLTVDEAAERLNLSKDTLYRRADDFPFTVRHGRKVGYSSNGIDRYIADHLDTD